MAHSGVHDVTVQVEYVLMFAKDHFELMATACKKVRWDCEQEV